MLFKNIKNIFKGLGLAILWSVFLFAGVVWAGGLVNINTADAELLQTLPGIGPTKASAIIDYREENGNFENKEDIMNVSGIGQGTFDGITDLITVNEGEEGGSSGESGDFIIEVVINEFLANPTGSDDAEWIELKNLGSSEANLVGWKISDATGKLVEIKDVVVTPGGMVVLEKSETGISLNNSGGETVSLYDDLGILVCEVVYSDSAQEGLSFARNDSGEFLWTILPTKGFDNIIQKPLDKTSESEVSSDSNENKSSSHDLPELDKFSKYKALVFFNEVLANPTGIDSLGGEWIELYNGSEKTINLNNWKLKSSLFEFIFENEKILSESYLLVSQKKVGWFLQNSGDSLVLLDEYNAEVDNIKLNKAISGQSYNLCRGDFVWLENLSPGSKNKCPPINEEPKAYFELSEEETWVGGEVLAFAGESYDVDGKLMKYTWYFDKEIRLVDEQEKVFSVEKDQPNLKFVFLKPGRQTIKLVVLDDLGAESEYKKTYQIKKEEVEEVGRKEKTEEVEQGLVLGKNTPKQVFASVIGLDKVKNLPKGIMVMIQGVVVVEPGVLGANIFYIDGLQIYMSKKDFPEVRGGDLVKITGKTSESYGEKRVNVSQKSDIIVLGEVGEVEILKNSLDEVEEEMVGKTIRVSGDVTELKAQNIWIDDGLGELRVYVKETTGIDLKSLDLALGDKIEVIGVVSRTTSGLRLLPRYLRDIEVLKKEEVILPDLAVNTRGNRWKDYLLLVFGFFVVILAGLGYKYFKGIKY